jgi:hypothetical protein
MGRIIDLSIGAEFKQTVWKRPRIEDRQGLVGFLAGIFHFPPKICS